MHNVLNYKLKSLNEDFQVTEVSLMPNFNPKNIGKFTYIWLQKSGFTTFEALEQIKIFFNLSHEDVCSQGLKDEDAITEQLISVNLLLKDKDIRAFNKKYFSKSKFSKIKYIMGYGNNPVRERALHGNAFKIVARNLPSSLAGDFLDYIHKHKHFYFINYYDNQRFGMPGGPYNTHLIGKAIIENNWKEAFKQLSISNNINKEEVLKTKKNSSYKEIFYSMNPKKVSFFVSAYNSYLWNIHASKTIKKHTQCKIYSFNKVGKLNLPTGHNFKSPHTHEVDGYELLDKDFTVKQKSNKRNLLVLTNVYAHDVEPDELNKNKKKITLSFFLPTGSYATMAIKQLFLSFINH